jgi:hypothetical protein
MMHKNDAVFSFTDFLKSFLPKKSWTPKIAMFGPGLESELTEDSIVFVHHLVNIWRTF